MPEYLEERIDEAGEDEVDDSEEVVRSRFGSPAIEDRVGGFEDGQICGVRRDAR